jgi:DNA helicase-4
VPQTWGPTSPGKLFTGAKNWSFTLNGHEFVLQLVGKKVKGSVLGLEGLSAAPGIIWATLTFPMHGGQKLALDGIPSTEAREMVAAVAAAREETKRYLRVTQLLQNFDKSVQPVLQWARGARSACLTQLKTRGWLTHEFRLELNRIKPQGFGELFGEPEVAAHLGKQPKAVQDAMSVWRRSFDSVADGINERHLAKEMQDFKAFFDKVEKSPLTEEQTKAVVCFDNRVLLVASAGSGKTSTMVAKAGYALKKGYFAAERMLLLAFNNDAAAELRERVKARLEPLGLPADKIVAKTFHAFGLDVIGAASGKRPSLASWVENGKDLEALLEIVDDLKDKNPVFRTKWDLFRLVLGQDLPKFGKERQSPDGWDSEARREGFWTLSNDVVKSRGEQLIANWLFYNGVEYVYEAPYKYSTADAAHRQYQPDFYLPNIDAYLEHWALDEHGEPPPEFAGYKEGIAWKKRVHADNGTTLLETTVAELWSGKAFKYLSEELTKRGVILDPDPERPAPGRKPIENPRLARTFRSFLTHAKSNRLSVAQLHQRLEAGAAGHFRYRHTMFLSLFEDIWKAWECKLGAHECIDFEDMLNLAGDCIEQGKWSSPYELVMVDEFQDASQARARLVAGLVKEPGRCLFAVGDDWQSINRFAGADLAVMTDFESKFGHAVVLRLEQTFRCPQSLCDISSMFVQKNPKQLRKSVRAAKPNVAEPVRIVRVDDEAKIRSAVSKRIEEIASQDAAGSKKARIYVLGRYNKDRVYVPLGYDDTRVEVDFITVHSCKGLEADHVILPRMTSETLGFPSRVADDPVLQLAMPGGDSFESAEERRLFYVALTRAKASVTLITIARKESAFITELVKDHKLEVRNLDGSESWSEVCPTCRGGFLVTRKSKYGPFYGCSRFPRCTHREKLGSDTRHRGYASGSRSRV